MAILNYDIAETNFELIRDRIAAILLDELDNQATRQADPDLTGGVFAERFSPPDPSEGNVLIVYVDRGNYSHQTEITQRGKFNYFVDIFTQSKQDNANTGFYNASKKCQRLAGLILNIIQAPDYKTLGFTAGIVYHREVQDIQFDHPQDNQETNYKRMGRVIITVEHHNEIQATDPITASGYDTEVKLVETEKGFQYINNN